MTQTELLARRERLLGKGMSTFYNDPVHLVRGQGAWLWDAEGRRYLDCYNNVPHVGHCHPRVVQAITEQASQLNTHTRYLHEGILDYVERLTGTLAPPLSSAIMTCTGSEANDIALRMVQAMTGRRGMIATDHTYHGNTAAVSQLSTRMPPLGGYTGHVRHVPAPSSHLTSGLNGAAYATAWAEQIKAAIADLQATEHGFGGIILCPFFANEGFPDLPAGFLDEAIAAVRAAGGIVISDEVQPGFGRTGTHFWGHEKAGLVPDILTLGKPMANGHPVGAVVTSPDILNTFRKNFRYFNTFGGNPVSCAAAMAVLDVIANEGLQANALAVGAHAQAGLAKLAETFDFIGNVRGSGLFFGAELVTDRKTMEPDPALATRVINAMREVGVLMGKIGVGECTTKIRPPMCFSMEQADLMLDTFADVLAKVA